MGTPKKCPCGRIVRRGRDGKQHDRCSACRGTSSSLKPKNGAGPTKPAAIAAPAANPVPKAKGATPNSYAARDLERLALDDLVALRDATIAELKRRQIEADETSARLREVLGAAA